MMKIKIAGISDKNNLEKERVVLIANEDDELGSYLLSKSIRLDEQTISSGLRNLIWFPDRQLKAKDYVVIYTRGGEASQRQNNDGTTSHFFYLNRDKPLWIEDVDTVVLVKVAEWDNKSVGPVRVPTTGTAG